MSNEADTCRKLVVPKLQSAGWDKNPHSINEQRSFTDGRVLFVNGNPKRGKQKRADYVLRYGPDLPIAVVEAKAEYKLPGAGMQQAKEYAEILGLSYAYSTNGHEILEFDYTTGVERLVTGFPTPDDLWERKRGSLGLQQDQARSLLTPGLPDPHKPLRYYQEIAINSVLREVSLGRKRVLLTLCTGSGKTQVAFQICWRLWSAGWNVRGDHRRPRILFLADRKVLIDDPKDKDFSPFGDARHKVEQGVISQSREMYFSTYHAIAQDDRRPGLYKELPADFFDLIVIDECHRGSARDESSWREILEYFKSAVQLGMTATPLREDNRDTYRYFGSPVYQYSLAQGISDGFLAPYRVHRVVTDWDAAGWRPTRDQLDRYGRPIPEDEYQTKDFERVVALRARTEAIARHLTGFLKKANRFDKTIIFCVDQEHADEMRRILSNLNKDIVKEYPDYVCRVTSDEGEIGAGHRAHFQDLETKTPVILTTSQLLTTGVDAPTCKNVVLARVVGSMTEFKQIIGRGTRLREDYGKLFFNIIDYTGTATEKFADPDFDGDADAEVVIQIDDAGQVVADQGTEHPTPELPDEPTVLDPFPGDEANNERRKYYVDQGIVEVVHHVVFELDSDGRRLRTLSLTDYTGERVRVLYSSAIDFRADWLIASKRSVIIDELEERGIDLDTLADALGKPEADAFDLLCHLAWNAPLRTRRERAEKLKRDKKDFFEQYGPEAREVLEALLEKYAIYGAAQFALPDTLKVPPLSGFGNISEIASRFSGPEKLRAAVEALSRLLYVA